MLFFNEDWMNFLRNQYVMDVDVSVDDIRNFIYLYKDTQITDFVLNVNGTLSMFPSKILESFADKYLATEENGIPVDYKDTFVKKAYEIFVEKNIDLPAVMFETLREIGIKPWVSIRWNDVHGNCEKTHVLKSSMVEKFPQYRVSAHREPRGYYDKTFDFSHAEVRTAMLGYIDEVLDRYDVDGLELDMMREAFFVQFGQEAKGFPVMKKLTEDIYAIVKKYEKKYGHEIKMSAIVPSNPNLLIERGLNVIDFADLLDYIIIIGRYETTDTDMPIELWKQLLRDKDVKLGCGQQCLYAPYRGYRDYRPPVTSVKMAYGQAAANLSRGGDFVYLYNYMETFFHLDPEISPWDRFFYEKSINNDLNHREIFENIGEMETILRQERSHVVTYCDFATYNVGAWCRLPVYFKEESEFERIKIPVGKIPDGARVRLILGFKEEEKLTGQDLSVYVNSTQAPFVEKTRIEPKIFEYNCYVFDIKGEYQDVMYAEIKTDKRCMLEHVEIEVKP